MEITVSNKFVREAPRKIRPVLVGYRGQKAESAITSVMFTRKKAADFLLKLLKSGIAAAKEAELNPEQIYIKSLVCNEGPKLKRRRFESKGRAARITKRMSHLVLTLTDEPIINKAKVKAQNAKRQVKTQNLEA